MITIANPVFKDEGIAYGVSCTDPETGEVGWGDDARDAYKQCLRVKYANKRIAEGTQVGNVILPIKGENA